MAAATPVTDTPPRGTPAATPGDVIVRARGITKRFGALTALAGVDMDIRAGEVTALLGDNGAGKSTFVKVLAGAHPATDGTLEVGGETVRFNSPKGAAEYGIATIYQELALSENLTVTENVFLGHELTRRVLGLLYAASKRQLAPLVRQLRS